jgi:hypothetical protein
MKGRWVSGIVGDECGYFLLGVGVEDGNGGFSMGGGRGMDSMCWVVVVALRSS